MKKILLVFVALNGLFISCSKDPKGSIPQCIQQRIADFKSKPVQSPPATISEYSYNGRKVYLLNAPCCDQFNLLLDENCNTICAPSGGIGGQGDGKCADFEKNAQFIRTVFKDERPDK